MVGLSLGNIRHAHSHLMYMGWVTPALMALVAHAVDFLTRSIHRHDLRSEAESRGDLANAEAFLKQGRDAAGDRYPKVVAWADRRIEGLPALAETLPIPSQDDLPAPESLTPLSTPIADDLLQDLLSTPDPATTGTDGDAPSASDLFPPASSEDDG